MANMLNNPEAISQAMSMITPEMMDQVSPVPKPTACYVAALKLILSSSLTCLTSFLRILFATFAFTRLSPPPVEMINLGLTACFNHAHNDG